MAKTTREINLFFPVSFSKFCTAQIHKIGTRFTRQNNNYVSEKCWKLLLYKMKQISLQFS